MANMMRKKIEKQEELTEKEKLEEDYKKALKDFAKHYVALWNALKSLGLSDPQVKGAISQIYEANNIEPKEVFSVKKEGDK